jgi:hypothetical protein
MIKSPKVTSVICGLVTMFVTVIVYLYAFENIFAVPIQWVSLMLLLISEGILLAKALCLKRNIFSVANIVTSSVQWSIAIVLALIFVAFIPNALKTYIFLNTLVFCGLIVADAVIIHFGSRVSIENNKANAIKVTTSTGDIELYNVLCSTDILLNVSTGRILLNTITCETLNSTGNTGKIKLIHVTGIKFIIERTTGDVLFDHSDANDIYVKTDTGDVKGSLLTSKVFICKTDTGDIDVPESIEGSKCKIITDTGDIEFTILK